MRDIGPIPELTGRSLDVLALSCGFALAVRLLIRKEAER
jgi:hypothetical protein